MSVEGLDALLSPEGWVYASTPPLAEGDPGRYHALFGRDSLITALQVLPARPDVARATLRALAAQQGRSDDPETDEEPGKILHEYRPEAPAWHTEHGWPVRDGVLRYYGSSDSTPWFLVLLAALGDAALTAELEAEWRAAGEWLERALVAGGGVVRYGPREHSGGLTQQGWRDVSGPAAEDDDGGGIVRPDGSTPRAPLADTDVQAVAYAALRALGGAVRRRGLEPPRRGAAEPDRDRLRPWRDGARGRRPRRPRAGLPARVAAVVGRAVARAARRRRRAPVRARRPDRLGAAHARRLEPCFDPQSYHRGSVWPFDSWLGWSGLRAAGRVDEAERVRSGVLAALDRLGHAPELYAVTRDGELEPSRLTNLAQAWTVGARWAFENDWGGRPHWLDNRPAERAP